MPHPLASLLPWWDWLGPLAGASLAVFVGYVLGVIRTGRQRDRIEAKREAERRSLRRAVDDARAWQFLPPRVGDRSYEEDC